MSEDQDKEASTVVILLSITLIIVSMLFICSLYDLNKLKNRAIEAGAAYYHEKTAEFTFKGEK